MGGLQLPFEVTSSRLVRLLSVGMYGVDSTKAIVCCFEAELISDPVSQSIGTLQSSPDLLQKYVYSMHPHLQLHDISTG